MKAVVYNKKGTPEKLIYTDVEKPAPGENEVLIKIKAVSLNAADYRSMKMGMIPEKKIFGADIAGVVETAGKNVTRFKYGDEVFGDLASCGFGGFAEYAVAPERLLAFKPSGVTFEQAAALPMASLTALQALRNKGNIQHGQKVLIAGSGGGVGTFAVQLAKFFGAEVTAVCSTKNVEQTKLLGANYVIDYTIHDFAVSPKRYDLIVGVNGNRSLFTYRKMLAPGGKYVMVGGALPQIFQSLLLGWLFSFGSRKMRFLTAKPNFADLEFVAGLVSSDKIKPVIDKQFTLERAAEAMNYARAGHARGKVVIVVDNEI